MVNGHLLANKTALNKRPARLLALGLVAEKTTPTDEVAILDRFSRQCSEASKEVSTSRDRRTAANPSNKNPSGSTAEELL